MRSTAYLGLALLLLFFAIGFSYFYPSYSPLSSHSWFANSILPAMDSWLMGGARGSYSGHVLNSEGELRYKSDNDFVFYPARGRQQFFGKTMISSGSQSIALIEVAEGVQIELKSNSLLVIEPQVEGTDEGPVIRVIGGAVVAKTTKAKVTKKVRVVASSGEAKVVDEKGVSVISDGEGFFGDYVEDIEKLREDLATQEQQMANQEQLLRDEVLRTEALKVESEIKKPTQEFVLNEVEAITRLPKSVSEERAVSVIVPKKIQRRSFNQSLAGEQKQAPKTSLSQGVFLAKRGKISDATRSFATALSSTSYESNKDFNPGVQIALNGLLESYELNKNCKQAQEMLKNAESQYGSNENAKAWITNWNNRLSQGKCKNQF